MGGLIQRCFVLKLACMFSYSIDFSVQVVAGSKVLQNQKSLPESSASNSEESSSDEDMDYLN